MRAPKSAQPARRESAAEFLPPVFYDRDTERVARDLLGAILLCESPDGPASGRIVETEAYLGPHDPACHAVFGLTPRTQHLFGPPGVSYVYLIYGMHWCFNAVTREAGHGSAVLIRALEPIEGIALMRERRRHPQRDRDLCNGPGKLCQALGITRAHDGVSLSDSALTISRGERVPDETVVVTPRIGITRAAAWPLRFFVGGNANVSRTPSTLSRSTPVICETDRSFSP
ncbi:MAG: DNA-3-methyladenine glycosylase [Anaerolineae bacterium]|nr:DNA-3-methyladenine glycosylase [Gemmatimonadaceae bacterium]